MYCYSRCEASANQPTSQPANQPTSQPANQPTSQPAR
ncbi:PT domain-containing protein [Salmonella enterica]|nr:PT domain-containing protein [Salmonella enterica]EKS7123314.1 PT domain-containing protein [Salmonella enterica]EKS7251575.1 PT domain-containing protein [Salmonella enterica]EKS7270483.1 PT domain-containing protein [Salmonella enterica]EKS7282550.1 PT domain-containing protein [Salmonella enterica]